MNIWSHRVEKVLADYTVQVTYANSTGQTMLALTEWNGQTCGTFSRLDNQGREVFSAQPSALESFPDADQPTYAAVPPDLMVWNGQAGQQQFAGIKGNAGVVYITTYDPVSGYVQEESIQRGDCGQAIPQRRVTYVPCTNEGATIYLPETVTVYKDENPGVAEPTARTGAIMTTYTYGAWAEFQPLTVTTHLPPISAAENGPGASADHVDIMAHSLGNLVMWEALRLHELSLPQVELVHNVINIEAAIWKEAFEPETPLRYPSQGYSTGLLSFIDRKTYTVDQQKRYSWRFWFNQTGHDLTKIMSGGVFNSYNPEDWALKFMQFNDWALRTNTLLLPKIANHYFRDPWNNAFRSVIEGSHALQSVPALLRQREMIYAWWDLNVPQGRMAIPLAGAINYEAIDASGWVRNYHSAYVSQVFPKVWKWYEDFLAKDAGPAGKPIPIGVDR